VISVSLADLSSTWFACDLEQTLTWSKLRLLDTSNWHCFLLRYLISLGVMTEQMVATWKPGVYHLLAMRHVDIEARINFSASVWFFYIFLVGRLILVYNAMFFSNFLYFYGSTELVFVLFHVLCPHRRLKILKFVLLYYFYEHKDRKEISFVCKSICLEIICRSLRHFLSLGSLSLILLAGTILYILFY
jgi:hypothetical protein